MQRIIHHFSNDINAFNSGIPRRGVTVRWRSALTALYPDMNSVLARIKMTPIKFSVTTASNTPKSTTANIRLTTVQLPTYVLESLLCFKLSVPVLTMVMRSNNLSTHSPTFNLKCTQINLARSRNATHELSVHLSNSDCHVAFVMEPLKPIPGYTTYQFHTDRPIKAAILVQEKLASILGISEYSNPNLCIVRIKDSSGHKVYLTSVYVEPRADEYNTIDKLEHFLMQTSDSRHVICGDLMAGISFGGPGLITAVVKT